MTSQHNNRSVNPRPIYASVLPLVAVPGVLVATMGTAFGCLTGALCAPFLAVAWWALVPYSVAADRDEIVLGFGPFAPVRRTVRREAVVVHPRMFDVVLRFDGRPLLLRQAWIPATWDVQRITDHLGVLGYGVD